MGSGGRNERTGRIGGVLLDVGTLLEELVADVLVALEDLLVGGVEAAGDGLGHARLLASDEGGEHCCGCGSTVRIE